MLIGKSIVPARRCGWDEGDRFSSKCAAAVRAGEAVCVHGCSKKIVAKQAECSAAFTGVSWRTVAHPRIDLQKQTHGFLQKRLTRVSRRLVGDSG
jgi:hypothetical protein